MQGINFISTIMSMVLGGDQDIDRLRDILNNNKNIALIEKGEDVGENPFLNDDVENKKAYIIKNDSDRFKILQFNVNLIKIATNFVTSKFLVYTDSYTQEWKVFIQGKEDAVYRTNGAFKGFWVPAGEHIIDLKFVPRIGQSVFLFIIFFFHLFLIYTLILLYKEKEADSKT